MAVRNIVLRNSSIYDYYRFDLLTNLPSLKARSEVKYDIFKSLFGTFCIDKQARIQIQDTNILTLLCMHEVT